MLHVVNEPWELVQVITNDDRNRTVNVAVADVQICAKRLFEREWLRTQSRMLAYERVGQTIGASGAWVRRFVKGYEGSGLTWTVGQNIVAAYHQLCAHIEAGTERMRTERHAAHQSSLGMSEGESSASLLPPNEY